MLIGKNMWNDQILSGLTERQFNNRKYDFYENVPENLFFSLEHTASIHPDKICIYDDEEKGRTYSHFLADCLSFANYLHKEKNIQKGSHVAFMMYNSYEFCVAFYACIRLGAVVIPLPSKYHQEEILSLCEKSDLHCVVCDRNFSDWFITLKETGISVISTIDSDYGFSFSDHESLSSDVPYATADDPAIIMYTSGTTARSKGVVIRNYSTMHAVAAYQKILNITEQDTTIIPVPIYHVTGLIALLGLFIYTGGTIYIHKFFDAKRVLNTAKEKNITFFHASPTVFSLLLQEKENYPELPAFTNFACGSSNMPKEKLVQIQKWLPHMTFHTVYGLTETSSPATIFPENAAAHPYIGSSGMPIPGLALKILGTDGKEVPAGEAGEVWLSGTVVLDNYYKMETNLLQDGWLNTGDIGYVTEDGYLFIVDRKKDMINRGGEKICSYDVENELYKIDGIIEAAVIGIPDEIYGETAAAVVKKQKDSPLDETSIKEILYKQLAKYKVPSKILFLEEIPLTRNLKVDKQAIKKLFINS